MRKIIHGFLIVFGLLAAAGAVFADSDQAVVDSIQKQYDATRTFQAHFVQKSYLKVMGQSQIAQGRVYIKKPGKMKWDYTAPDRQILISNAEALWLYLPEESQVTKMQVQSIYSSNAPALFLAGKGKLTESFQVKKINRTSKRLEVTLIPREPDHNVDRLVLFAHPKNHQIIGSRVYDKLGNQTEMIFSKIQINPSIEDGIFEFKVPEGVELIDFSADPRNQ